MEQQMPPQEPPKQITSMGSVFGTPMTGFALVNQGAATPPTAERTAAIMPTDVLTQDVMTLKVEVKELKNQIEEIKKSISALLTPLSIEAPSMPISNEVHNPLAPVKKKPGRPKKGV